jgi:formylmethanofuran dehydrogenase subunit E
VILNAKGKDIYKVVEVKIKRPEEARIYSSLQCSMCKEKVMEPKARIKHGKIVCIPCSEVNGN